MSLIQKEIADFSAQCYQNNTFRAVTKADVLGKWSVFFFYPADFTFVCPTELEDLADNYAEFKKIGCEIYSVSTDTHFTHKAWHDSSEAIKKVEFPMLGDPTGQMTRNFGVMIESAGLAQRGTFVINPEAKSMTKASDATPKSFSARFRLPNSSKQTPEWFARLNGNPVRRP